MIEVTFEDIYNGFQLPCPAGLVLLPGWCHISDNINNVFFSLPQVMKFTLLSTQTQSTRREIKTIILVSSARSLDTNVLMTSKSVGIYRATFLLILFILQITDSF